MAYEIVEYVKLNSEMSRSAYTVLLMLAEETKDRLTGWIEVSYTEIAKIARLEPTGRTAKRCVMQLWQSGELGVEFSKGHDRNRYRVAMSPGEVAANLDKMSQSKPAVDEARQTKRPNRHKGDCDKVSQSNQATAADNDTPDCDIAPPSNGDRMSQSTPNLTVTSCPLDCDITPPSTVTSDPSDCDIASASVGDKGGLSSPESSSPVSTGEESGKTSEDRYPPQPPDGGCVPVDGDASLSPRSKGVTLPKHRPADARWTYLNYPVREGDAKGFVRTWQKVKPDEEACAKIRELLSAFEGRKLTPDEKASIIGIKVFLNQTRWDNEIPFKGLAVHEIRNRPYERRKTVEDVRQEAEAAAAVDRHKQYQHVWADRKTAEATESARIDAAIAALPEADRQMIEDLAVRKAEGIFPDKPGRTVDRTAPPWQGALKGERRQAYVRLWEQDGQQAA